MADGTETLDAFLQIFASSKNKHGQTINNTTAQSFFLQGFLTWRLYCCPPHPLFPTLEHDTPTDVIMGRTSGQG